MNANTATPSTKLSAERALAAALALGLVWPMLATVVAGVGLGARAGGLPFALSLALAALPLALLWHPLARRLPAQWDGRRRGHGLAFALLALAALLAIARLLGVALYMADAGQSQFSAFWFDPFYIGHSCYSAYWQAAELAREGAANLYDVALYTGSVDHFKLDEFMYLPQFVLLPELGLLLGGDFYSLRAVWFGVEAAIVLAGLWALAAYIGQGAGRRAWLLMPLVMVSSPIVVTLQVGNFQLAAISLSVLAMIQFERGRNVAGGAMLGFAIFKLFPGLLGIYLLATKRWRAAIWTFAFSVFYSLVALAWFGKAPFEAFLQYQAPRIASGDAWAFLEIPGLEWVSALNQSVPGAVLKAKALGLDGMTRTVMGAVSWVWTALAIALTLVAAARNASMTRLERAAVWVAVLGLATMRSPFLPDHSGLIAPMWLWSLIAAAALPSARNLALLALGWLACTAVMPVGGVELPELHARILLASAIQAVALGLCVWAVLRKPHALRAGAGAGRSSWSNDDSAAAAAAGKESFFLNTKVVSDAA
ncbi:membrane protein [Lysobacter enzymogenes]|uniref:Membrane protein n=1 Tax=Lysobacter enzymogenes TaxID=69 RepID=A0A0S2DBI6_LYSEN|nr:glycosyltransferase family 87 protein [Lysobacter enzymogenes]ALN55895.1 membrane protein [Lysobacter enzymogenes]QCW24860.1 DUF2029 domain-containing protein [Lysobacter enzymogenes]